MKEFLIIVGIALVLLLVFIFLDKGKDWFKKIRLPKLKKEIKKNKIEDDFLQDKIDYDTVIKEENIEYGKEPETNMKIADMEETLKLFAEDDSEQDEIDLDKMYEELRRKETDFNSFENSQISNFEDMSMSELDSFLEQSFNDIDVNSFDGELNSYGYDKNLTGEELGRVLKKFAKTGKDSIIKRCFKKKILIFNY